MKEWRVIVTFEDDGSLHFFEDFATLDAARMFAKKFKESTDLDFFYKITYLGDDPKEASLC